MATDGAYEEAATSPALLPFRTEDELYEQQQASGSESGLAPSTIDHRGNSSDHARDMRLIQNPDVARDAFFAKVAEFTTDYPVLFRAPSRTPVISFEQRLL